jgi:hypothetical protein
MYMMFPKSFHMDGVIFEETGSTAKKHYGGRKRNAEIKDYVWQAMTASLWRL